MRTWSDWVECFNEALESTEVFESDKEGRSTDDNEARNNRYDKHGKSAVSCICQ